METTTEPEAVARQPWQLASLLPRLWRVEIEAPHRQRAAQRRRHIFRLLCAMVALLGAIAGLLSWVQPLHRPLFAPLWVANYQSRLMPLISEAAQDRQAIREGGYFPRTLADAYASQERAFLVKDLNTLKNLPPNSPAIVYLTAFAGGSGADEIFVFPADVNPDEIGGRLPLRQVLEGLRDCRSLHKLLILDIMRPVAAMGDLGTPPGRLGVLADDVARRVPLELEAVPDPRRLVLCSCSPGQVSYGSPVLNRSIFGYYLEEGLRGWADVATPLGKQDGRISVRDLSLFLTARVERWVTRNLNERQTPILYGNLQADFNLIALSHGAPAPHLEIRPAADYPAWLREDWQLVEKWRADGSYRLWPRGFRQMEAFVFRAEHKWRLGFPAEDCQKERAPYIELFRAQLAQSRESLRLPEPRSLAMVRAQGGVPDPALAVALRDLLTKINAQTRDLPADKAQAIVLPLATEFLAKVKGKSHFDLADAVFAEAVVTPRPRPERIRLLDQLLRAEAPQPRYVETVFLRQLAEMAADLGSEAWPADSVHLALEMMAQSQRAMTRPAAFPWVRGFLDQAAQSRRNGIVLLLARGYAPLAEADRLNRQAADQFATVLSLQDEIETAQRTLDRARAFLPAYLSYLEHATHAEESWHAAVRHALDLETALQPPREPPAAADLRRQVEGLRQLTDTLLVDLQDLGDDFTRENVARLIEQSRREDAGPAVARAITAILATPFVGSADRAAVWKAGDDLARRLNQATIELDRREEASLLRPNAVGADREHLERLERDRALRRARAALGLFQLGGIGNDELSALRDAIAHATARPEDIPALADRVHRDWADLLPSRLQFTQEPHVADRLAWVVSPFDAYPVLLTPRTRPRLRVQLERSQQLWAWLAEQYRSESHDVFGGAFFFEAARDYSQAAALAVTPETFVDLSGCADVTRLTRASPVASCTLRVKVVAPTKDRPQARLRLVSPDADWLRVIAGIEGAAAAPLGPWNLRWDNGDDANICTVPLQITLKPDAERSSPPPRGFLVEVTADGRAFHHLVTLSLQPAVPRPEIVLSADPQGPTRPLGDLRLRAAPAAQPFYLYVRNPTEKAATVVVELSAAEGAVLATGAKQVIPPNAAQRATFLPTVPALPAPASGVASPIALQPAQLPELNGPLHVRLLDAADPNTVITSRRINVNLALPREYVDVSSIRYVPADAAGNQLSATLKARTTLTGPPAPVEMVLPAARMPGFLGARDGTFRGTLPADGADLQLFAQGLRFEEGAGETGFVYLNVDSFARAFIFRATFAARGDPTTPTEDYRLALRLRADASALSSAKFPVTVEVDNAPSGATLEVSLGRKLNGSFEAELVRKLPEARRRRIGFSPSSLTGALLFDALIEDWQLTFDTRQMIGPRFIRARVLDTEGRELKTIEQGITFGDTPPGDVQIVASPKQALRGTPLTFQAMGFDTVTGIKSVVFFAGKPVDGKVPPNTATVEATALPGGKGLWTATVTPSPLAIGMADVSVQFINGAGLSQFATTSVELLEKLPPQLGKIVGTVTEGGRVQVGLEVTLNDEKAPPNTKPRTAVTDGDGKFVFADLAPGSYKVIVTKPIVNRKAEAPAAVEAGKTVTLAMELLL